jgi:hypothetical protein
MKFAKTLLLLCCTQILLLAAAMNAQQAATSSTTAIVPRLVNFSGKTVDAENKPVSGIAGITFSIYKDQYEGAPLWMETQNVTADTEGNYAVQLGATKPQGLPLDLFSSGEARWLGVRINGGEEQPRVLLLSVPYALKAADAQTLGGLPASAFALAAPNNGSSSTASRTPAKLQSAISSSVSGTGATDYIPLWTNNTGALGDSVLYQLGTKIGVNTKSPAAALDVNGKVNASSGFDLAERNFAFGSYANDNAFLGFAGNTTMTGTGNTASGALALQGNTSGFGNTATGWLALQNNTAGCCNTAAGQSALQGLQGESTGSGNTATGYDALAAISSGSSNTATGISALQMNGTGSGNTATGAQALQSNTTGGNNTAAGSFALESDTTGSFNTAAGSQALEFNTTGPTNTASGYQALQANTTGGGNTAIGGGALEGNNGNDNTATGLEALGGNTSGSFNTATGYKALESNTTGINNTAIGDQSGGTLDSSRVTGNYDTFLGTYSNMSTGDLINATAIGACAVVSASNALVLGTANSVVCGDGSPTKVGINVSNPSNILTVLRGGGHAIADGWDTYSSRRWKTNIQTLHGALAKVEQMRGVSYDLKNSGKHEIGVIAEEVGAVVPELVTYEDNGKDARSVDYSRLTALLIEAVKQQQQEIQREKSLLRRQAAAIHDLKSELHETRQSVEKIKAQAGATQPTLVAEKISAKSRLDEGGQR